MAKLNNVKIEKVDLQKVLDNTSTNALVKLRHVDVVFGKHQKAFKAINDLSLNINSGEVLGLVGESGSGKSTTGNAILGLVPRSNGEIIVNNQLVPSNPAMIKGDILEFMVRNIQAIFQDPSNSLNPYKNIFKVVSEGLDNINLQKFYLESFDHETIIALKQFKIENQNLLNQIKELVSKQELNAYKEALALIKEDDSKLHPLRMYLSARDYERNYVLTSKQGKKQLKKEIVIDMLNSVGLSEGILNRYPLEFSGGQQQRIGISRAVVLRPKLLIADEPISALDVSIQAQVVNIFNDLKQKMHLTILFIAHDLRMVEYISDRIAIMYKGVLVEFGPAKEVAQNPIHPYSKSLLDAVPSIDNKVGSLLGYQYDARIHNYSETNKPEWFLVNDSRYVYGTKEEIENWTNGKWQTYDGGQNV